MLTSSCFKPSSSCRGQRRSEPKHGPGQGTDRPESEHGRTYLHMNLTCSPVQTLISVSGHVSQTTFTMQPAGPRLQARVSLPALLLQTEGEDGAVRPNSATR